MSVFGSLFTAVSGLSAQSDSISMISNNIANVSTIGYKRTDAAFSSLVTTSNRSTAYSSGSVRSVQNARISQQGILQQSSSATDIAISGNGFFVVRPSVDTSSESLYTRAGSFSEDSNGILRNSSGFYLQGWPIDQNGMLPSSQADISSLAPVNLAALNNSAATTSTASLAMNLKASEVQSPFPVASGFTSDFSRSIKVFDSLGAGHDLSINFKKMASPTATAASAIIDLSALDGPLTDHGFAATDAFDITVAGETVTVTLDGDVPKMLADINALQNIAGEPLVYARLDTGGNLVIKARNPGDDITLADGAGAPLASLGLTAGSTTYNPPAAALQMLIPTVSTPSTEGWWTVEFRTPEGASIAYGAINFDGAGQLNAAEDLQNKIVVNLNGIDWGNDSDPQDIAFDTSGFTQFSGQYNVISSEQNGAELGLRTGISIDEEGFVTAQFSNGQSSRIYKLAIATFSNANGLNELTGNVFRESDTSGSYNLREAGQGAAGDVASGTLEASNVDLADEFSKMIVTQRAYSANTKVISTADQMMQELLQLR